MCECVNVEFGSYDACVAVDIPPHMEEYRKARLAAGLSGQVGIDRCILPEIQHLWSLEIRTHGSCCGHNKLPPFVNVDDRDIERMKSLGYEVQFNPSRPGDEDAFTLKGQMRGEVEG